MMFNFIGVELGTIEG